MYGRDIIRMNLLITLVTTVSLMTSQHGRVDGLVKELHYGRLGGLSLECEDDELILVEREELGFSRTRGCHPQPTCTVPYTHASWYCRGLSVCTGMQVERRPLHKKTCGSDFTNCVRVTYQCVKTGAITNICSNSVYEVSEGFLASPRFPNVYPSLRNCTCTLSTTSGQGGAQSTSPRVAEPLGIFPGVRGQTPQMELSSPFFLLKHDEPCKDVLNIDLDSGRTLKKCGYLPLMGTYVSGEARVNFQSDRMDQDMGFVIRFRAMTSNSKVRLQCGRNAFSKQISAPVSITTTSTTTSHMTTAALESVKQDELTTSRFVVQPYLRPTLQPSPSTIDLVTKVTNKESAVKLDQLKASQEGKSHVAQSYTPAFQLNVDPLITSVNMASVDGLRRSKHVMEGEKNNNLNRDGEHRNSRDVEESSDSNEVKEQSNSREVKDVSNLKKLDEHSNFSIVWEKENFNENKRPVEPSGMEEGLRHGSHGSLHRYQRIDTSETNRDPTKYNIKYREGSVDKLSNGAGIDKSNNSILNTVSHLSGINEKKSSEPNRETFSKQFGKSGTDEPIMYERGILSYAPKKWSKNNEKTSLISADNEDYEKANKRYETGLDIEPANNHVFPEPSINMHGFDSERMNDHRLTEQPIENKFVQPDHKLIMNKQPAMLMTGNNKEQNQEPNPVFILHNHSNNLQHAASDSEMNTYSEVRNLTKYSGLHMNSPLADDDNNDNVKADLMTFYDAEGRRDISRMKINENIPFNSKYQSQDQIAALFKDEASLSHVNFPSSVKYPIHPAMFQSDAALPTNTSAMVKAKVDAEDVLPSTLFENEDIRQMQMYQNLLESSPSSETNSEVDNQMDNYNSARNVPHFNYPDEYQRMLDKLQFSAEHAMIERNYKIGISDNETQVKQISFEPIDMPPQEEIMNPKPAEMNVNDASNTETGVVRNLNKTINIGNIAPNFSEGLSQNQEIIKASIIQTIIPHHFHTVNTENATNHLDIRRTEHISLSKENKTVSGEMRSDPRNDLHYKVNLKSGLNETLKYGVNEAPKYADLGETMRLLADKPVRQNTLSNAFEKSTLSNFFDKSKGASPSYVLAQTQDPSDKMKELAINYYRLAPVANHYVHGNLINQKKTLNDLKEILSKSQFQDFNLQNSQHRGGIVGGIKLNTNERKARVLPDDDKLDAHKYEYSVDNKLDAHNFEHELDNKRNAHEFEYLLDNKEDGGKHGYVLESRDSLLRKPTAVKKEQQLLSVTAVPLINKTTHPGAPPGDPFSVTPQSASAKETIIKVENSQINDSLIVPLQGSSVSGVDILKHDKRSQNIDEIETNKQIDETMSTNILNFKDKHSIVNQGTSLILDNDVIKKRQSSESSMMDDNGELVIQLSKIPPENIPVGDLSSARSHVLKSGIDTENHFKKTFNRVVSPISLIWEDLSMNGKSVNDVIIDPVEAEVLKTNPADHEDNNPIQWFNTFHVTQQLEMGVLKNIEIPHPTRASDEAKHQHSLEYGHEDHDENPHNHEENALNVYSMLGTVEEDAPELAVLVPARRALDGAYYFKPSDAFNDRFFSKQYKTVPGNHSPVGSLQYGWNSIVAPGSLTEPMSAEAFHKSPDTVMGLDILGGRNITWAIFIVGIVGWLVFAVMLGLVIHYRRKSRQTSLYSSRSSAYSDFHIPTIRGLFTSQTFASAYPHTLDEAASTSYESVSDITDHVSTTANSSSSPNIKPVVSRSRDHSCKVSQQNRSNEALDENASTSCNTRPRVSIILPSSGCVEIGSTGGVTDIPVPPPFFNELTTRTTSKDVSGKKSTKSGEDNTRKLSNDGTSQCLNSPAKKRRQLVAKNTDVMSHQSVITSNDALGNHGIVQSNEVMDNKLFEILSSSSTQSDSISALDIPPVGRVGCATNWALAPATRTAVSQSANSNSSASSVERGYADMGGGCHQKKGMTSPSQVRRVVGTGATVFGATGKTAIEAAGKKSQTHSNRD